MNRPAAGRRDVGARGLRSAHRRDGVRAARRATASAAGCAHWGTRAPAVRDDRAHIRQWLREKRLALRGAPAAPSKHCRRSPACWTIRFSAVYITIHRKYKRGSTLIHIRMEDILVRVSGWTYDAHVYCGIDISFIWRTFDRSQVK